MSVMLTLSPSATISSPILLTAMRRLMAHCEALVFDYYSSHAMTAMLCEICHAYPWSSEVSVMLPFNVFPTSSPILLAAVRGVMPRAEALISDYSSHAATVTPCELIAAYYLPHTHPRSSEVSIVLTFGASANSTPSSTMLLAAVRGVMEGNKIGDERDLNENEPTFHILFY